jgi:hypothetical protein
MLAIENCNSLSDLRQKIIDGEEVRTVRHEPCEDAIWREDALMALTGEWTEPTDELIHQFIRRIKNLPPAAPQPQIGRWVIVEDRTDWYDATYECSCCKRTIVVPYDASNEVYKDYPYCHCGAKMVEPQESEG